MPDIGPVFERCVSFWLAIWKLLLLTFIEKATVADLLAHHGHSLDFGFHVLSSLPRSVLNSIQADIAGIVFPRFVPSNN
ncbi:hypothetical protein LINGRAHAP2_LOCUS30628 [Linum grandiflorum]